MGTTAGGHFLHGDLAPLGGVAEEKQHGRPIRVRGFQLSMGGHLDEPGTHRRDGAVVAHAVRTLYDDLVLHTRGIRQTLHLLHVGAGYAGSGQLGEGGGAAIGDQAPLALHNLGNSRPDTLHQFVDLDITCAGLHHGLSNFRQNQ